MIINKKYIRIPAGIGGRKKAICFKENDELIFDVEVDYKEEDPDFVFYQPTLPIMGKSVNIYIDDKEISLEQTDEKDDNGIGAETLRPYIHFSARRGWINDPNGLCFDGKKYHMFFQHNPVGILWGNMHWGHAISYDLLNWQETDDVLFPDKFGTMYSGSAIIDKNNVSGLSKNGEDVLCLFYTSCGNTSNGGNSKLSYGMESLQHLAYSNDGGITFTKYEGNPIVSGITKENRDPKVIYADEIGMYIMALYLENNDYMLLTSKDLIHWEERQRISIEGETECPDIYPLTVENEPRRLWVMSGAADKYLVGEIFPSGDLFRPIQCVKSYQPQRGSYAAQTFSGIEKSTHKNCVGYNSRSQLYFQ